jgi:hypothetical protein
MVKIKMQGNKLKDFVLDYFKTNNAKVLESKKHFTIQVTKRIADKLSCEPVLNITFDKQYAEKNEDIDFIAIGSALLNKIIEASEKRGLTAVKYFKGEKFNGLEMNFKVTFESIDKKERLFSMLVDLNTKKINNDLLKKLINKNFEEANGHSIQYSDIEECYNICAEEIKKSIAPDAEKIREKLKNALEKEKQIIEKFYDGIIADIRKKQEERIRIWKDKKEKAHTSQYVEIREKFRKETDKYEEKILEMQERNFEELNNYFQIKQKRLKEIENQYKLTTKLLLYSAALVIVK